MSGIPDSVRNNLTGVLCRIEAGERVRVTVDGRPVAELAPIPTRPRSMAWEDFIQGIERWRTDPGLTKELVELLPDSTDDLPIL